jgi:hypothetical protein
LLYWLALAYYRFHGREINEQVVMTLFFLGFVFGLAMGLVLAQLIHHMPE